MKLFEIIEFDKDYRTVTDYFEKPFSSIEEAEKWAKGQSCSGIAYYVREKETNK